MKPEFIIALVALVYLFNFYKFYLFVTIHPYPVFPEDGAQAQNSSSSSWWLTTHLLAAFANIHIIAARLNSPHEESLIELHYPIHYFFIGGVVHNLNHLGTFDPRIAVLVNGLLALGLEICFAKLQRHPYSYRLLLTYFSILYTAPGFEMGRYFILYVLPRALAGA